MKESFLINEESATLSIIGLASIIASYIGWELFNTNKEKLEFFNIVKEEATKSGKNLKELKSDEDFLEKIKTKIKKILKK
jgi:hypothetical protein